MLLSHAGIDTPCKKVYNWWGRDNEETYAESLLTVPPDWKYHNTQIEYHVNSHGYRCPEFEDINWKQSCVILGCSVVFGLGVGETETVSYLLEQQLGYPVINLGVSGSGCDWQYWNAIALYNQGIRPHKIIVHWPNPCRGMFFNQDGKADTYINSNLSLPNKPIHISRTCDLINVYAEEHHWYKMVELYSNHLTMLFGNNIVHAWTQTNPNTLKNYDVPDFVFEDEKNSKIVKRLKREDIHNLARDLEHPGVTINKDVVVPYLLNKIS